jgi:hypothetical protein
LPQLLLLLRLLQVRIGSADQVLIAGGLILSAYVLADSQTLEGLASSGQWRNDDYDVICKGAVVGRLFLAAAAPQDRQWMWIQHRTPAHGYEPTRETAMAAFAKSWRR